MGVALRTLETRDTGSRPLVFLHGRGHAGVLWAPILAAFAARARSVVAFDLPGFGRSGAPPTEGRGIAYFADPIEDVLRSLDRPVVVGHSLGGYVALTIALRRRVALGGLVLVDAMGIAERIPLAARAYLLAGPERLAHLRATVTRAPRAPDGPIAFAGDDARDAAHLAMLREEILRSRGTRDRASAAFAVAMESNVRARLGEIADPTLLVWGADDETFPLPHAIHARAAIDRAELVRVDAGHSPHLARPSAVTSAIAAFLDARGL